MRETTHYTVVGNGLMGGLLGHRKVGHFRVHIGCKLTVELDASIENVMFLL